VRRRLVPNNITTIARMINNCHTLIPPIPMSLSFLQQGQNAAAAC
jgi:hypothetical protein